MKKTFALLLSCLLLSGCTPDTADEHAVIPLRVWVGDHADIAWMENVIQKFTAANPDNLYDIRIGAQNEGDAAKVILADVESAADVFTFAGDQLGLLLNAGALMPVTDHSQQIISRNIAPSVEAATGPDGQLYAYPATSDNGYFLFYDSRFFSDADIASLETMLDLAATHKRKVAVPMTNAWYLYSFFRGAGLEMQLSEDGLTNRCNWNASDTPVTGVQVVTSLLDIADHPGFADADSDVFVSGLKDGSIIAGISGTWNAAVAAQVWGEHYAAAKLPTYRTAGQDLQMASFSGFKLVGVHAYSPNVGAAMDLAAFMTDQDAQLERFRMRRQGPSNTAALAAPEVQQEPAIAALIAQSPYADIQRVGSKYWDAAATLGKIIVSGNPEGLPLQTLLDHCVAGITAPADQ